MTVVAGPEPLIKTGFIPAPDSCGFGCQGLTETRKGNPHWDFEAIDLPRLRARALFYAKRGGVSDDIVGESVQDWIRAKRSSSCWWMKFSEGGGLGRLRATTYSLNYLTGLSEIKASLSGRNILM